MSPSKWTILAIVLFVAFPLLLFSQAPGASASASGQPTPGMVSPSDRLAPPPTVYPPTQADQGAQVFYQVCMACHGDRGQGLTEEWRNVLGPPDNNCWQSKCHAANHPPDGFVLPKTVPAVVGPDVLAGFKNAKSLHDFLQQKMPWQAPGTLKPAEYWQLTAFVMRLNGADPGKRVLDDASAATISFDPSTSPPIPLTQTTDTTYYFLVAAILGVAFVLLVVRWRRGK